MIKPSKFNIDRCSTKLEAMAGFYSKNPESINQISRYIEIGNGYISKKIYGAMVHMQPFGGYKLSGVGSKEYGIDYLS